MLSPVCEGHNGASCCCISYAAVYINCQVLSPVARDTMVTHLEHCFASLAAGDCTSGAYRMPHLLWRTQKLHVIVYWVNTLSDHEVRLG
jgi:hypothetical protein